MVTHPDTEPGQQKHLSVLALSSRFDGRSTAEFHMATAAIFQYSLCRVVLMVPTLIPPSS